MAAALRFYGIGLLLSAGMATTAVVMPGWLEALGVEFPPPAAPKASCLLSAPAPQVEVLRKRLEAKQRVMAQLEAGELDLFEAAAWFRYLDGEPAEYAEHGY